MYLKTVFKEAYNYSLLTADSGLVDTDKIQGYFFTNYMVIQNMCIHQVQFNVVRKKALSTL